jgi:hypothetical protein
MEYAHRGRGQYRFVISFSVPFIAVLLLTSGCTQTLRQQYIDASDPCSSAREPIVKAGDDLDARQRQMANQIAQQQMQGHELPVVTQYGNRVQLNLQNAFTNAVHQNMLANQNYTRMKQQETGENAAAMIASVQGDASNDLTRLRSVTGAMQALRACRATQINVARSASGSEADRVDKLRQQQAKLNQDDELITKVFGQYGDRAQMYASAAATVPEASLTPETKSHSKRRAPRPVAPTPVEVLQDDQRNAQVADRKQSETLHETLQNSIAGA